MNEPALKEVENRLVQLNPNRMRALGGWMTIWTINAEPGSTRADLLKPDYWSHAAQKLTRGDKLIVRSDEDTFIGEYYVIACDRTWAKVLEWGWKDIKSKPVDEKIFSDFEYKYRGPHSKHCVVRKSDGAVMIEKHPTKDAALRWMADYRRTVE